MKEHVEVRPSRNSNIELLRILAMFLIVLGHASMWSDIAVDSMPFGWNRYFLRVTHVGDIGANIFILISGYCMSKAKFSWKKVLSLVAEVVLYSLGIAAIFAICTRASFDWNGMLRSVMPITNKTYWFISVYLIIYIFSPYINKMVDVIEFKSFSLLLIILTCCWILSPTFLQSDTGGFLLEHMLLVYLLGAYLRKLEEWKCFAKRRIGQILIFSSLVIMCLAAYIFDLPIYAGTYTPYSMFDARTLPTVALAIGMVLVMIDLPFRSTRWVNSISSCVFGVYLIHEHPLMREWIWETVFPLKEYVFSDLLFVVCIGKAIGVYVVCMLVDMARKGAIKGLCCGLQHGRYIHCR